MQKNIIFSMIATSVITATLTAGCASVAVTDDAITQNTAVALGLEKGQFKISNRMNSGVKTSYDVTTNAGKHYSCYVTGSVSVVGRIVSDAVCDEVGKTPNTAKTNSPSCNALLKAAGKC